jgi:hypothetical protein
VVEAGSVASETEVEVASSVVLGDSEVEVASSVVLADSEVDVAASVVLLATVLELVAVLHSAGTVKSSLWAAALRPRPREANTVHNRHLLAPPYRLASAWIHASRALKTGWILLECSCYCSDQRFTHMWGYKVGERDRR